ncbi:hypothetical protein N9985_01760 [Gammaproteobacteria bacterium]|nr:hypothetical protein [Gammaproteobacteria bacterium]
MLDQDGLTLVYREPVTLHQLAVIQRRRNVIPSTLLVYQDDLFDLVAGMLSKTWSSSEVPIIKATDSCNNIIDRLLSHQPGSTAILLYSQLEDFLISNLKSPGRRNFLGKLVKRSQYDAAGIKSLAKLDISSLDTACAAAFVWIVQMHLYRNIMTTGGVTCMPLDAEDLLRDPAAILSAVCSHLDLGISEKDILRTLDSPVWSRHAKDNSVKKYGLIRRQEEKGALRSALGEEITRAVAWVNSFPGWSEHVDLNADPSPD